MIPGLTHWYWSRHFRRNGVEHVRSEMERFSRLNIHSQRLEMGTKLQSQLRFFASLPGAFSEWVELSKEEDPLEVFNAWSQLPIQTKHDLQTRFTQKDIQLRLDGQGVLNCTGGSTGEPTHFVHDTATVRTALAIQTASWIRMGWRPGLPILSLWGAQRDIGAGLKGWAAQKRKLSNALYGFEVVDGFAITEAKALAVLDWIDQRGPIAIYGYTSLLDFLARVALSQKRVLRNGKILTAWNGGECLFSEQSERFKAAFGVPILNYYAGRELGGLACQPSSDAPLNIPRPFIHLEVVDDQGRPAAPGEPGRIVVTSTQCKGTPFLRYEIGDLGSFLPEHLTECGLSALAAVEGRVSSLLSVGGKTISNIYWNHLFKEFPEIQQFQVAAITMDHLELRFVGQGFQGNREQQLLGILGEFLGPISITIHWMERIPLTSNGKLIQVIQA